MRPLPVEVDAVARCEVHLPSQLRALIQAVARDAQAWYEMVQLSHWKSAVFGSKRLQRRHGLGGMTGFGGGGVGSRIAASAAAACTLSRVSGSLGRADGKLTHLQLGLFPRLLLCSLVLL